MSRFADRYFHVVTNGYLLDEDTVRMLAKNHTKLVRVRAPARAGAFAFIGRARWPS